MRGFVRRAAREMRGSRTVGDKRQPVYAGAASVCRGSREVKGSPGGSAGLPGRCRGRDVSGRDVSLPAVTTKAPGSKDRGARVCVSSCYAIDRRQHWLAMEVLQ